MLISSFLRKFLVGSFLVLIFFATALYAFAYVVTEVELISISTTGGTADGNSSVMEITDDNRYVLFESYASDLVAGDSNGTWDIFLRDRSLNTTELISMTSDGSPTSSPSYDPRMSDDARYIAFESYATDLVEGDTNGVLDVFVYDRDTDTTTLISRMSGEDGAIGGAASQNVSVSDDGSLVVFDTYAPLDPADILMFGQRDIYIRNTSTNISTPLSMTSAGTWGNGASYGPQISGNGDYVVFTSEATNLESGDANGATDIFIKKPSATGSIWRINKSSSGEEANGDSSGALISDDGHYISYTSSASNLVSDDTNGEGDIFLYDYFEDETILISRANGTGEVGNAESYFAQVNEEGTHVVFISEASNLVEGDTNGTEDVFVYDIEEQTVSRVSTDEEGNEIFDHIIGYTNISPDGSTVVYNSYTEELGELSTTDVSNIYLAQIEPEAYNLFISDLSYDETSTTFSYTVANDGNANIPVADIYSTITVTFPDASEESYVNLDSDEDDDFLQKGASSLFTMTLILEDGTSTIQVCTDSGEDLEEADEDDNCDELSVSVGEEDDDTGDDDDDDDDVVEGDDDDDDGGLADDADDELTCDNPFEDTVGHWGEKTICLLYMEGTVSGKSEGIFDPDSDVTRAEMLKMILLNSGEEIPLSFEESSFSDVDEEDWYFGYVMHALDLGVVEGYDDGTFRPNDSVNRAEALTMLLRMADVDDESSTSGLDFDDLAEEDWYYDEVGLGVDYGLVEGYDDGTFKPGGSITRAEAATIVRRAWYVWYE